MKTGKKNQYKLKDRDDAERKLLKAAQEVFAERGYEGATTRMIADLSGINLGLISRYFGNKRGLLIAVLDDLCKDWILTITYPPQKTLAGESLKYAEFAFDATIENNAFFRIFIMQAITDPDFAMEFKKKQYSVNNEIIERFARHMKKDPEKDRKSVQDYISTIDYILSGIYLSCYLLLGESKKECIEHIRAAIAQLR